jgi:type II secretory ATPase GspE/PulE/Tfp pilus assembly ATPase PilB-like protein
MSGHQPSIAIAGGADRAPGAFSTLHTNDAPSAVTRLFNIGVEPYLVAASLRAVLAQRLVRKICSNCKEPVDVEPRR